jgi:hypothetical protein
MKPLYFTLAALVMLVLLMIFLRSGAGGTEMRSSAVARLEFPAHVDAGEQESARIFLCPLSIANRGTAPLELSDIQTDCTCSGLGRVKTGEFLRLQNLVLGPGEAADLAIRAVVKGINGSPARHLIQFRTNDPLHPQAEIEMVVPRIKAGFILSPGSVMFGSIPPTPGPSAIVDVYDDRAPARKIDRVTSSRPDQFSARLLSESRHGAAAAKDAGRVLVGRIEVASCSHKPGPFSGEVLIQRTGSPDGPDRLPVFGSVVLDAMVRPSSLVLPRHSGSGPLFYATCLCSSTNGRELSLATDRVPEDINVQFQPVPGNRCEQLVRIEWQRATRPPRSRGVRFVGLRAKTGASETRLDIRIDLN